MKSVLILIIFLLTPTPTFSQPAYPGIKKYQVYYASAKRNAQEWLVARKFEQAGKTYLLLIDPHELETKIDEEKPYEIYPMTLAEARQHFANTPYTNALKTAEERSVSLQDAGIQSGMPKETGITLTADLCPSHRPLDRRIFTDIFREFQKVERPAPVALSITGYWMNQHQPDLEWLKAMQRNGEIYITWINHSYTHRVSKNLPLKENFLLEPGTDISYEVLATEQDMLKNGLLPSVFFRFPGLVSDQQLVYAITGFGLIPIGSDAWLAKGQKPQAGSIVLIHGNGNEPLGVADFIKLLKAENSAITKRQWLLYDLRESVEEEFGK